jgi:hypothetical protein
VQKVSNLILNENVYIDDAKRGIFQPKRRYPRQYDESSVRGMRYLLRYNFLEKR